MSEEKRRRHSPYKRGLRSADKSVGMMEENVQHFQPSFNGFAESWQQPDIPEPHTSHDGMMGVDAPVPHLQVKIPPFDEDAPSDGREDAETDHSEDSSLREELRAWANEHHIKHNALDALLKILQRHGHQELPSSSRTLMQYIHIKYLQPQLDFQRMVLQQLASVTQQQNDIMQMLRRENIQEPLAVRQSLLAGLDPATSEHELQVLEGQLKDKDYQMKTIQYLSSIGGKDVADGVRRVMAAIATHSVWRNYSVHGKKGKMPLKNMTIYHVILRAVMASSTKATMAEVAHHIQETLKHSPARCKKVSAEVPLSPSFVPVSEDEE